MTGPGRERVVVAGIDGSAAAREVTATAVGEAVRRGCALHLVHALSWPTTVAPVGGARAADVPELGSLLHAAGEAALRTAAGDAADVLGQDRVSWAVESGDPATAVVEAARDAEVLVLGSRGAGGVTGLVLGSTVSEVLLGPPCPVLLVPDPSGAVVRPRSTVVAAVQGRPGDDAVLAFALTEAATRRTDLLAVHAWQDVALETAVLSVEPRVDWAGALADEQRVLSEALAGRRDEAPDVTIREAVVRERPARALLAAGLTAQLLVLGARRHRGLARLGSTTHAVVHRATCPVAVVPVDHAR
ncbi:universal stress protein [Geodermatophilus sp. SYSU D00710]